MFPPKTNDSNYVKVQKTSFLSHFWDVSGSGAKSWAHRTSFCSLYHVKVTMKKS